MIFLYATPVKRQRCASRTISFQVQQAHQHRIRRWQVFSAKKCPAVEQRPRQSQAQVQLASFWVITSCALAKISSFLGLK